MNKEDTMQILSVLENDPALARQLADIVFSQLNRTSVAPAQDEQDLLKILETSGKNFRELLDES